MDRMKLEDIERRIGYVESDIRALKVKLDEAKQEGKTPILRSGDVWRYKSNKLDPYGITYWLVVHVDGDSHIISLRDGLPLNTLSRGWGGCYDVKHGNWKLVGRAKDRIKVS